MNLIPLYQAIVINNESHHLIIESRGIYCCCSPIQRKMRIDEINKVNMNKNIVHFNGMTRTVIACTIIYKNDQLNHFREI